MRLLTILGAIGSVVLPAVPASAGPSSAAPAPAAPATQIIRYDFDAGATAGGLRLRQRGGGSLGTAAHNSGRAVTFPPTCPDAGCPRVILEGVHDPRMDPGIRSFRYGATVRVQTHQTGTGQNIVQKGVATSGSQWKLQIDGYAGRPSCVVVARNSARWYVARSSRSVADGGWHRITCQRTAGALTVEVDGAVHGRVALPAGLVIANDTPLRIGGKGLGVNNDQYRGAVDDVFFALL